MLVPKEIGVDCLSRLTLIWMTLRLMRTTRTTGITLHPNKKRVGARLGPDDIEIKSRLKWTFDSGWRLDGGSPGIGGCTSSRDCSGRSLVVFGFDNKIMSIGTLLKRPMRRCKGNSVLWVLGQFGGIFHCCNIYTYMHDLYNFNRWVRLTPD